MNFTEYTNLANRTCKSLPLADHINHMALGIVGEMGELVDQIKKAYIYGKGVDQVNIVEEVGDVAWYVAGIAQHIPALAEWMESDELRDSVDIEKLTHARKNLTRAILMNAMSMTNLAVDITMLADSGDLETADAESVAKIIGTGLFATALLLDVDLPQAYEINIAKLAKRYGDKYSDFNAVNRDTDAERAVLEAGAKT